MHFPPKALSFLDRDTAGLFLSLRNAILKQKCTFVLGAGVSSAVGAPTWGRLLNDISASIFDHLEYVQLKKGIPAKKISIAFTNLSGESRALAKSITAHSPLLAAQLLQNCVKPKDWNYLIRKLIYDKTHRHKEDATKLVARLVCLAPQLEGVINFNYDDLLERHLLAHSIDYQVLTNDNPTPKRRKFPVYHPHGWLPEGGGQDSTLVLSEADYNERSHTPYSWSNVIQIAAYCTTTSVFIGHSMTDPSLRSLLRATAGTRSEPHFAFLPTSFPWSEEAKVVESLFDNDLRRLGVRTIRYPTEKKDGHIKLWDLIRLLGDSIEDESAIFGQNKGSRAEPKGPPDR